MRGVISKARIDIVLVSNGSQAKKVTNNRVATAVKWLENGKQQENCAYFESFSRSLPQGGYYFLRVISSLDYS